MYKLLMLGILASLISCTSSSPSRSENSGRSAWYTDLRDALLVAGLSVEEAGEIDQPFWNGRARVLVVEGEDLQVYSFAERAAAEEAAAEVAPGGGSIGTNSMAWMKAPRFYRNDSAIVILIGSNPKTLALLESRAWAPFAQRK